MNFLQMRALSIAKHYATSYLRCMSTAPKVPLTDAKSDQRALRPFEELNHIGNTFFGRTRVLLWLMRSGANHITVWNDMSEKHGPIYRVSILKKVQFVVLTSAEGIKDLFENLARYVPNRLPSEDNAWHFWRQKNDKAMGLLSLSGEEWAKHRAVINVKLQALGEQKKWFPDVQDVNRQLISRLRGLRDPVSLTVPRLCHQYQRMALEVVCQVVMEEGVGALEPRPPQDTEDFIRAVRMNFVTQMKMGQLKHLHEAMNTKLWQAFDRSMRDKFAMAEKLVTKKQGTLASGARTGGVLEHLLERQDTLTERDVVGHLVDILMAGTDTTANTLGFLTWHLAQNPRVQQRLRDEVTAAFGQDDPDMDTLMKLQYPRWCMKEVMRLEPIIPLTIRSADHEMAIGGYRIPPNMPVALHLSQVMHDPNNFDNPREFIPERWSRDSPVKPNPYASLPFLMGIRVCAGRRLAELELMSTMAHLVKNFRLDPVAGAQLKTEYRGISAPGPEIPVRLVDL